MFPILNPWSLGNRVTKEYGGNYKKIKAVFPVFESFSAVLNCLLGGEVSFTRSGREKEKFVNSTWWRWIIPVSQTCFVRLRSITIAQKQRESYFIKHIFEWAWLRPSVNLSQTKDKEWVQILWPRCTCGAANIELATWVQEESSLLFKRTREWIAKAFAQRTLFAEKHALVLPTNRLRSERSQWGYVRSWMWEQSWRAFESDYVVDPTDL
jgi:hypothetical protein